MEDDRETFEQDQILRDRELTEEEVWWIRAKTDELEVARRQLAAEIQGEPHAGGLIDGRDEWAVTGGKVPALRPHPELAPHSTITRPEDLDPDVANGIDASTNQSLGGPIAEPMPPTGEAQFGDRRRESFFVALVPGHMRASVAHIAAAIDRDAGELVAEMDRRQIASADYVRDLRHRVEEAVERLKYVVETGASSSMRWTKDVIDAEPLLEALGEIFGERAEQAGARAHAEAKFFEIPGHEGAAGLRVAINPGGEALFWPVDPAVGQGFALHPVAARDLALLLTTQLPEGPFSFPTEAWPEHEPARDRREQPDGADR